MIAAMTWWTDEVERDVPDAGDSFAREITTEIVRTLNATFSGASAGSTEEPAGVAYGASSITSSGATADAIGSDIAAAVKRISAAGFAADTVLASEAAANIMALKKVANADGLTIGRMRLVSGPGVTGVTVLDSSRVAALGDRVILAASTEGDIEVADPPGGNSVTPTAAQVVSLFATNTRGLMGLLAANWQAVAPSDTGGSLAIVSLVGASYG